MEQENNQPIMNLTHTTTFFLAGCFAIVTIVKSNVGIQYIEWPISAWVTIAAGAILLIAALALVVTTFPWGWLTDYTKKINEWSIWLYPFLLGITLTEVLTVLIESINFMLLLIPSSIFLCLIFLSIFLSSKPVFQNIRSLIILAMTLNIISISQIISIPKDFEESTRWGLTIILVLSSLVLILAYFKIPATEKKRDVQ